MHPVPRRDEHDYAKLAPWWADVAKASNTQLYIGEAVYKVTSGAFTDPAEPSNHLSLDAQLTAAGQPVHGNVYYSSGDVRTNALGRQQAPQHRELSAQSRRARP